MRKNKDKMSYYITEENGSNFYPYFRSETYGKFGENYYPHIPRKLKKAFKWFSFNNRKRTRIGGNKLFCKIDNSITYTEFLRFDNDGYQLESLFSGVANAYKSYIKNIN